MTNYRCIDCGKPITIIDVKHGGHRCSKCDMKRFNKAIGGKPRKASGKVCPICGSSLITIDSDNDQVVCGYCNASWESIRSFNEESRRR